MLFQTKPQKYLFITYQINKIGVVAIIIFLLYLMIGFSPVRTDYSNEDFTSLKHSVNLDDLKELSEKLMSKNNFVNERLKLLTISTFWLLILILVMFVINLVLIRKGEKELSRIKPK